MPGGHINWIDQARGVSLILIVMAGAALSYAGLGASSGWMGPLLAWAEPLALPAFFLISGLTLPRILFAPRSVFFDRKVLHFVYFYAIWLVIDTAIARPALAVQAPGEFVRACLMGWIVPPPGLWLVHGLALFHLAARLTRFAAPGKVFGLAALLQVLQAAGLMHTGWPVFDHFAQYYVFFFSGYAFAPVLFELAGTVAANRGNFLRALAVWAAAQTGFVALGADSFPVVSLILGFTGAFALIVAAVLCRDLPLMDRLAETGRNALPLYLGAIVPMTLLQVAFAASGLFDPGTSVLLIAAGSVAGSLALHHLLKATPLALLYVRPARLHLKAARERRGGSLLPAPMKNA